MSTASTKSPIHAYIGLSSNLGDRVAYIERACRQIEARPGVKIVCTSPLYENAPAYYLDQPTFLNGVCQVETTLEPHALLDHMQAIENDLLRVREIPNGPRVIDLDLLLYGQDTINSDRLIVPHRLMTQREFVLRPFCDIAPELDMTMASSGKASMQSLLNALPVLDQTMKSTCPLGTANALHASSPSRKTQLMAIINVTPDSFSDGGSLDVENKAQLRSCIEAHVRNGANILDIGGQSTRPDAAPVSAEEEIRRIVPAIQAATDVIATLKRPDVAISVDTYRASVASAAISHGAHIVNDVSAGRFDPGMLPMVAKAGCNIVLMHMRGDPFTMSTSPNTLYPNDLIETIAEELRQRIAGAERAGIRRWRMLLDPGIGFAKVASQNLTLLRDFAKLRAAPGLQNIPWVHGCSRKRFIGDATSVKDPAKRDWGTAATIAASVQGGADVVRVHTPANMKAVLDMSNAIWRQADPV